MKYNSFSIEGPVLFEPRIFSDDRGYFMETFKADIFKEVTGSNLTFVQDNQSLSKDVGTVRGLHFQAPPHAQGKLVRCLRGKIIDVVVDARINSSTYGQHIKAELTDENGEQLWVPPGFLHGFVTLVPDTVIVYKCTDYYAPECDGNVLWNDPDLGIDWGLDSNKAILSNKDSNAPRFKDFESPF